MKSLYFICSIAIVILTISYIGKNLEDRSKNNDNIVKSYFGKMQNKVNNLKNADDKKAKPNKVEKKLDEIRTNSKMKSQALQKSKGSKVMTKQHTHSKDEKLEDARRILDGNKKSFSYGSNDKIVTSEGHSPDEEVEELKKMAEINNRTLAGLNKISEMLNK